MNEQEDESEFMSLLFTEVQRVLPFMQRPPACPNYSKINEMFAGVPIKASTLKLMAHLRGTFCIRQHVTGWHAKRDLVAAELDGRGLNAAHMLRGLYKD